MNRSRTEESLFPTLGPLARRTPAFLAAMGRMSWRMLRVLGRFTRRWWWRVSIFVLILVVAHSLATLITWRQLQAEIDGIRARGEYTSLGQIKYPIVPDAENGALIYEKAEALLPKMPQRPQLDGTPFEQLLKHEGVVVNQFDTGDKHVGDRALWDHARAELERCSEAIAMVKRAQKKPRCFFGIQMDDTFHYPVPKPAKLGRLAMALAVDTLCKAKDRDTARALESVGMLFRLQDAVKEVHTLSALHQRAWLVNMASRTLSKVCAMGHVNEFDARRLSDQLAKIDLPAAFPDAMLAERAWVIDVFEIIREKGNPIQYLKGGNPPLIDPIDVYFSYVGRPLLYHDELTALRSVNYAIRLVRKPYRNITDAERNKLVEMGQVTGLLEFIFAGSWLGNRANVDSAQAGVSGSRILLALQVHKSRHGEYPASLSDLKQLGWKLDLEDPFSGKDFIYRRAGNGFVLYSIGQNLKDEGGWDDYSPALRAIHPRPDKPDDIVWKLGH